MSSACDRNNTNTSVLRIENLLAEPIVLTARGPEMCFIEAKSKVQHGKGVLFISLERLVHQ